MGISLDDLLKENLELLAIACNKKPTTLAEIILSDCLDNPRYINYLQEKFNVYPAFRIIPKKDVNGNYKFVPERDEK